MPRPKRLLKLPQGVTLPVTVPLPGEGLPYWKIITISHDVHRGLTILSNRITLVATHYLGQSTMPCLRDTVGTCEWCAKVRRQVTGFLPVWEPWEKQIQLLPLTAGAVRASDRLSTRGDLAGRTIQAWRTGRSSRGPVKCEISPEIVRQLDNTRLFSQRYVLRVLLNIWGFEVSEESIREGENADGGENGTPGDAQAQTKALPPPSTPSYPQEKGKQP